MHDDRDDDAPPRPTRRPRRTLAEAGSGQVPADDATHEPLPAPHPTPALKPHGDRLTAPAADDPGDVAGELAPRRLLSFYDRLRRRIAATVERRGGRLGRAVADALLLVPDVFMLLVRLAFDRQVPTQTRTLIGGALAYFVLPFDLLPEAMVGAAGFVDDLVLTAAVLSHAMSAELEERVRHHWSGRDDVLRVLQDVTGTAHSLLGEDLFGRLRALLARRGVVLEGAGVGSRALRGHGPGGVGEDEEELGASGDVGRSPYH